MNEKYEKDGEIVLAVSCTVPGITVVPPGMKAEDAIKITDEEHQEILDAAIKANIDYVDPVQAKLDDLQTQVDELQQIVPDISK